MNSLSSWKGKTIRFLSAQTISLFGSSLVQYALIWYITLTTSSGKMLTLSTLCGFVPQILISLFAGVWVDRYDRKKMIMLADAAIALSTLILAVLFICGFKNIGFLLCVLVVRSAGTGLQTPAVNAMIPQFVPKEHLMRVNSIHSTLSSLMMFLSPAVSGVILSLAPLEVTLFVDVVTAIIGIGITATLQIPFQKRSAISKNSHIKEIREGFSYLGKNIFVRRLLIFQITVLFLISPSAFLTPLMVSRSFGPEVWRLTASEMTYSLGMVLGGLLLTVLGGFKEKMNTTLLAGALYGALMIAMGLTPFFLLYLFLNTCIGLTSPCYNAPITVSIQENVDPSMHGRVFSLMQISTSCALPLGMVIFGPLADFFSVQSLLITGGSLVLMITFLAFKAKWFHVKNSEKEEISS